MAEAERRGVLIPFSSGLGCSAACVAACACVQVLIPFSSGLGCSRKGRIGSRDTGLNPFFFRARLQLFRLLFPCLSGPCKQPWQKNPQANSCRGGPPFVLRAQGGDLPRQRPSSGPVAFWRGRFQSMLPMLSSRPPSSSFSTSFSGQRPASHIPSGQMAAPMVSHSGRTGRG